MEQQAQVCAHRNCNCSVTEGLSFCSDFCESHAVKSVEDGEVMCGCGHPECGPAEGAA